MAEHFCANNMPHNYNSIILSDCSLCTASQIFNDVAQALTARNVSVITTRYDEINDNVLKHA